MDLGVGGALPSIAAVPVGLERWATIHKCWTDLSFEKGAVAEDELVAEVLGWKGKRGSSDEDRIRGAISGMVGRGLLSLDG